MNFVERLDIQVDMRVSRPIKINERWQVVPIRRVS